MRHPPSANHLLYMTWRLHGAKPITALGLVYGPRFYQPSAHEVHALVDKLACVIWTVYNGLKSGASVPICDGRCVTE